MGQQLREKLRASDSIIRFPAAKQSPFTVARLGGDEFAVILDQIDEIESLPTLQIYWAKM